MGRRTVRHPRRVECTRVPKRRGLPPVQECPGRLHARISHPNGPNQTQGQRDPVAPGRGTQPDGDVRMTRAARWPRIGDKSGAITSQLQGREAHWPATLTATHPPTIIPESGPDIRFIRHGLAGSRLTPGDATVRGPAGACKNCGGCRSRDQGAPRHGVPGGRSIEGLSPGLPSQDGPAVIGRGSHSRSGTERQRPSWLAVTAQTVDGKCDLR